MIFLLLFALIIFSQIVSSQSFLSDSSTLIQAIGLIQLVAAWGSFILLIVFFSQRKHNDFKNGFTFKFTDLIMYYINLKFQFESELGHKLKHHRSWH